MKNLARVFLAGFLAVVFAACQVIHPLDHRLKTAASFHSANEGSPMRRVAMLPLCFEHPSAAIDGLDQAFQAELAKTGTLEVVPISRSEMETRFGRREMSSVESLPADLFSKLVADYGVEGVLLTDITYYFPYRPISVGLRSKLIDAHTAQIRWAYDHVFDSGDPAVAAAAQQFYLRQSFDNSPLKSDGSPVLQSPSRYAKFVANETFRSLLEQSPKPPKKSAD